MMTKPPSVTMKQLGLEYTISIMNDGGCEQSNGARTGALQIWDRDRNNIIWVEFCDRKSTSVFSKIKLCVSFTSKYMCIIPALSKVTTLIGNTHVFIEYVQYANQLPAACNRYT